MWVRGRACEIAARCAKLDPKGFAALQQMPEYRDFLADPNVRVAIERTNGG